MGKMTWAELEDFIRNLDHEEADKPVMIYDAETGAEKECDIVQFSSETGWDTYIGMNLQELETN
jgi:hypothetical protein